MAVKKIKMPVTPPTAYDPKRPANALLLRHVKELETAVSKAGRRVRRKQPQTEGQAAAYLRHLNRALHQQLLLPPMKRRVLDVPIGSPSRTPATKAKAKKKAPTVRKRKQGRRS